MAGQPAEHPSERPKSNRFSVSLFASAVSGATNDVLKLVTSLTCFIFRFLRRPREELAAERQVMLAQVQAEADKAAEIERRNHELTGQVAAMREQIEAFERRIAGLEATLSERDAQLSEIKNDLATARATLDSERSAHQNAMAELRKSSEEKLASAVEQHKKELALQDERATEERRYLMETTDQIRTAARVERDRLFSQNARLESERDDNFAQLTAARNEAATWRGKAEATQENLAAERQRADRAEAELRAALTRPGPTLEQMISECDPAVPPPADTAAWDATPPVGKEKL